MKKINKSNHCVLVLANEFLNLKFAVRHLMATVHSANTCSEKKGGTFSVLQSTKSYTVDL